MKITKTFSRLLTILIFLLINTMIGQVTLETHQNLNQNSLWFWYSNPNKPSHLFNRNISPKGDCIQVINGYVFITWFKGGMGTRNLMLSRLNITTNRWKHLEFPDKQTLYDRDYRGQDMRGAGDSHRTASVGVSPIDGTIHLAYDMHTGPLQYRISNKNIAFAPDSQFTVGNFSRKRDYFRADQRIPSFTYPNFELNNRGELIVEYRLGTARQGDKYIVYYNGEQWSRTQLLVKGNNENPEFNQYGGLSNYFGKMYLGCAVRIKDNATTFNQGFYFASSGARGNESWKNLRGQSFNLPIRGLRQMNNFRVATPLPNGHDGMTSAPSMVVSKNGAVHFTNRISGTGTVHYYSSVGGTTLRKAPGNSPGVSFPADDGRVYSIGLSNGRIRLQSTMEGQHNWRTDYLWNKSQRFGLMEYDYQDGKLYIIASENRNSDKLPLHYIVLDLGFTPASNKAPVVSFKNPIGDFSVNEGYNQRIEVTANDPDGSVSNVQLYINNNLIRQENSAPYEWGHDNSPNPNEIDGRKPGSYIIKAVATDNQGKKSEKSITMTVRNKIPVNQAPKVFFKSPANDLTVEEGYKLVVEAGATDSDGSIQNLRLFIDNTLIRTERHEPYEWGHIGSPNPDEINTLKAGKYTFRAVATDDKGATAETSFILTVTQGTNPDPVSRCDFGTPRGSGIPFSNQILYTNAYVVGTGGPRLDNFKSFVFHWDPRYNGLYQFAMETDNGIPDWYLNLSSSMTYKLQDARPEVNLHNTGINGLNGSYWVNQNRQSLILVSKLGDYSIHFSNGSTPPTCTKIQNEVNGNNIVAQPNPFDNVLTISGFGKNVFALEIYTINGRRLMHKKILPKDENVVCNTANLYKGVYFAKLLSDSGMTTIKVVKQ